MTPKPTFSTATWLAGPPTREPRRRVAHRRLIDHEGGLRRTALCGAYDSYWHERGPREPAPKACLLCERRAGYAEARRRP